MKPTSTLTAESARELTYEKLEELIRAHAQKGHSKLDLSSYTLGDGMKKYLQSKGFIVYESSTSSYKYISW